MNYDDDLIEEQNFKSSGSDEDENLVNDIDGTDIPEELNDLGEEEEGLLDKEY